MQMQYIILWLYKTDIKILKFSIKIRYNIYSIWWICIEYKYQRYPNIDSIPKWNIEIN